MHNGRGETNADSAVHRSRFDPNFMSSHRQPIIPQILHSASTIFICHAQSKQGYGKATQDSSKEGTSGQLSKCRLCVQPGVVAEVCCSAAAQKSLVSL